MINYESVRTYCLSKRGAKETYPFGPDPFVAKVCGKMFALLSEGSVALKCDPEIALNLREQNPAVKPGYHLNKKHWNTVSFIPGLTEDELNDMIDHSYDLIVKSLTKAQREELNASLVQP
ncbi:MmcQ/YjbR family DNA-binding protein [Paenibacillus kobensis]|uniref:MmcQ/YjbR family DNA-binding protein n=1 Tax=Paenibacillus kobensis TaxID=59841 RepID=UPI000FD86BB7|nr:MmcQ/YjbR family DNA-binding protein [Paenibacillus kobensis]